MMKAWLIRLLIFPQGLMVLLMGCAIALTIVHFPVDAPISSDSSGGDEFPDQKQGGGTHWSKIFDSLA